MFALFFAMAVSAAYCRNVAWMGGYLPNHPNHGAYVLAGYVVTWGSFAWFGFLVAAIAYWVKRRNARTAEKLERDAALEQSRAEWRERRQAEEQ